MSVVLQIGDRAIEENQLYPLLAQYRLLPQLAREILIDRAIVEIDYSSEETAIARQRFYQQNQLTSEDHVQAWLDQHGMTAEQLEHLYLRDLKLEKFKQQTWQPQLDSYFLKCKRQLDRVVYSLIRTKEAGIAQELYFRIQEGEDAFADLARRYSEGAEAQTGGLIGPVELNVPHPNIAQILAASQPGQLAPPTRVGDWWVILRLEKYLSAQLDDPTRQRLLNDLFQGWLMAQMQQEVTFSPLTSATDVDNVKKTDINSV